LKIGFICSFSMQEQTIKDIASHFFPRIELLIDFGVLEEAIPIAKEWEKRGVEAIVTWPATAAFLETHTSIPLVAIRLRDFDFMKAVKHATRFGRKIAIVTHEVLTGLNLVEEVYNVKIKQIIFKDTNDLKYGIIEACNEGCEVIIGKGSITVDLAKRYNKEVVLITYDPESVKQAFHDAIKIATVRRRERENYVRLEATFNTLSEAVLVIDTSGRITLINHRAEKLLGLKAPQAVGQPVSVLLPQARMLEVLRKGASIDDDFVKVGDTQAIGTHRPIMLDKGIIGVVSTFREIPEIQKIESKVRRKAVNSQGFIAHYSFDDFTAQSVAMKKVIKQAKKFAETDSTVLITGETGTGKEVLAQSIHRWSRRSHRPFVAINCSVLPENLLESELFGYEEGAFTGAKRGGKMGLFELAHEGTIFLDEIGTMPMNLQSKLLRVLEARQVMRLGGERLIPIDVRVIAATNEDLTEKVRKGLFRKDLYFRLNVLAIRMPSLMERPEDIPHLVLSFVSQFCKKYGKGNIYLSNQVLRKLTRYSWPGNVRQLQNVIERLVILYDGERDADLLINDLLSQELQLEAYAHQTMTFHGNGNEKFKNRGVGEGEALKTIKEREKERLVRALEYTNFNISRAASLLGVSRSTIYRKLRVFGLL